MRNRGQLVVLAGAIVAVALIPVLVASLQVTAVTDTAVDRPGVLETQEVLRTAVGAHAGVSRDFAWSARVAAAAAVREALAPTLDRLASGDGRVIRSVAFDGETAQKVAASSCPRAPDRRFGGCEAFEGVVLQERAGEPTVVAVAVRVSVIGPDGSTTVTVVVRPSVRVLD